MKLGPISAAERILCHKTISAYAFYALVVDALDRRDPLSVVRVSDGEKVALDWIQTNGGEKVIRCMSEKWRKEFGVEGITGAILVSRLCRAIGQCTFFSPTLGFFLDDYKLTSYFPPRDHYVDELYQYEWSQKWQRQLLQLAETVGVITRDPSHADRIRKAMPSLAVNFIRVDSWRDSEGAIKLAQDSKCRLYLLAAAMASKYIAPVIANTTGSVVLDIGQAVRMWIT